MNQEIVDVHIDKTSKFMHFEDEEKTKVRISFAKQFFFPYFQPLMRYRIGVAGCGFGHFFFVGEKHVLQTREKPTQRKMDWKLFFFSGDRINNLRKGSNRTWVNIPQVCPKYTYERISSINRWLRVVLGNFPRVCWSFLRFVPR